MRITLAALALAVLGLPPALPSPDIRVSMALTRDGEARYIVPVGHVEPSLDLLVNVPQRRLFHRDDRGVIHSVPIAVGRPSWPTPVGPFTVAMKEEHPTWDVPVSIQEEMRRAGKPVVTRVPPGPANPLGDYWIGTSIAGLGIHGTREPKSISHFVSHGCIRLRPEDIAALFPLVRTGARGLIVYEPVLMARTRGGIFVEVHPDAYRRLRVAPLTLLRRAAEEEGLTESIDWRRVEEVLAARRGVAERVDIAAD